MGALSQITEKLVSGWIAQKSHLLKVFAGMPPS